MPPSRNRRAKRRKKNKNYVPIPFSGTIALSSVATNIVVVSDILANLSQDLKVIAVESYMDLLDFTALEGPLIVGVAHGDYSVTEIKEYLDLSFTSPDDKIAQERAGRLIRKMGVFSGLNTDESLNDGKPVWARKMFWKIGDGSVSLDAFAMNRGGGTLTSGLVRFSGTVHAEWLW